MLNFRGNNFLKLVALALRNLAKLTPEKKVYWKIFKYFKFSTKLTK